MEHRARIRQDLRQRRLTNPDSCQYGQDRTLTMNPLKRKLVNHPRDWPWSSFSFYSQLKGGLIRVDPVN